MAVDTIEKSFFATLTQESAAVIGLIGPRCFPLKVPNGSQFPALTYRRTDGARLKGHDGQPGFEIARFEIRSHGSTFKAANDLAVAVKNHLNGFSGVLGGGLTVQGITMVQNWFGDQDADPDGFVIYQEYRIPYKI